jgi:FtsZ-binding cell division protein ZapB
MSHDSGARVASFFIFQSGPNRFLMGRSTLWDQTYVEAAASFRAPIFYDSNDTGYYVNPNGISRIGGIQINAANPIQNEIRFYGVTGDAPSSYNHTGIFERIWRSGDESELLIFKGNDPDVSTIHDRVRIAATGRVVFHSWNTYGTIDDYMGSVGGNINGSGFFNGNDLYVTGNVIAYYSDERLKDIIGIIPNALSKIMSLRGFYYTNNETAKKWGYTDDSIQLGLSAQEVQKVFPEVVTPAGFDVEADGHSISGENYLTVQYDRLIPVLVEAIKEQQNQIDALKSGNKVSSIASSSNVDIDAMNKEMNQLKSENQMFKEKFELLEKSISLLCESGCAGLEKAKQNVEDVDALYQSIPNPTDNEALINYYLSKKYNNASIQINSLEGKNMETIMLDGAQGKGSIKIQLGHYAAQTYFYSLIVDNKVVDTKKLTVIR